LIAAATRDGRTEIAVVLNVADTYGWAAQLLDAAFAQPVPKSGDRLPAIPRPLHLKAAPLAATRDAGSESESDARSTVVLKQHGGVSLLVQLPLVFVGMLLALWSALRARLVMRRRRRRLARAHGHNRHALHRRPRTHTGPPQHRSAVPERTSSEV
jgi:hypothetical protein